MKSNSELDHPNDFALGHLTTEGFHPLTSSLAELAQSDAGSAQQVLTQVDAMALEKLKAHVDQYQLFADRVRQCGQSGGRVILVGCGATARLGLKMEKHFQPRVLAVAAGGDIAYATGLAGFEDSVVCGAEQIKSIELSPRDWVVGISEGGETNFVLGALAEASKISQQSVALLCCNPRAQLAAVPRVNDFLDHVQPQFFAFDVGPMAIAGSTRLQAMTALRLVVEYALAGVSGADWLMELKVLADMIQRAQVSHWMDCLSFEESVTVGQEECWYRVSGNGDEVFTDWVERIPTFGFKSINDRKLNVDSVGGIGFRFADAADAKSAWNQLLGRSPRSLKLHMTIPVADWPAVIESSVEQILEIDFSDKGPSQSSLHFTGRSRKNSVETGGDTSLSHALIQDSNTSANERGLCRCLAWHCDPRSLCLSVGQTSTGRKPFVTGIDTDLDSLGYVARGVLSKLFLNQYSNILAARLKRYSSNLMLNLVPTNQKLVDRLRRHQMQRHLTPVKSEA